MRERPNVVLPICIAAASAALAGRAGEAGALMDQLLHVAPELSVSNLKDVSSYLPAESFERWMVGLRKAGLPE